MAVIISELVQAPAAAESAPRGDRGGGGSGGAASPPGRGGMIQVLRRESSRQARLWAD